LKKNNKDDNMRINIKDETFDKIYKKFKEIDDKEVIEALETAKERNEKSNQSINKKVAAINTAKQNAHKTRKKVQKAFELLTFQNEKITIKKVSEIAEVSYNTAKKYLDEIRIK